MKKQWQKPELIVLYRGKPEETILAQTGCKGNPGTQRMQPDRAAGTFCVFEHGGRIGDPCDTYSAS